MPHRQYLNQALLSGYKRHTVQFLNQAKLPGFKGHSPNLNIIIQQGPTLSFKLYLIQLPISKAISPLEYNLTRTQAIFQAIFDSIAYYQGNISTHIIERELLLIP